MNQVFIEILNNALVTSLLIVAVLVVRFMIKPAPKWIACGLWALVAIKLVFPISIESVFSLVPSSKPISSDMEQSVAPHIETGIPAINQVVNPGLAANFTPQPQDSVNPLQIVSSVCAVVWVIGVASMLFYLFISYFVLRRTVRASKNVYENIYICDEVSSPFILGIVKPRIYLPSGLSDEVMTCVLEHERTHLKRYDHLWKPIGFLILAVYWFQPLCWVAYTFLCKDIEFACDEKVTKDKDKNWKATYCQALLDCNAKRRIITACPVAFGEVSVKHRIKFVLNYKKPTFWIVVMSLMVSVVAAVCFMTSPVDEATGGGINKLQNNRENGAYVEQDTLAVMNAKKWAKAFVNGDGETIISMATEEVIKDFEHREILIKHGDDVSFGFGSSPMLAWKEGVTPYFIVNEDEVNHTVDILYFVWTSDPHVTVWREQITYRENDSEWLIDGETLVTYDNISSVEELFEAYPFELQGSLMDYEQGNHLGTTLNNNALLSSSNLYKELFNPETAALNLLNITRDGTVSTEVAASGDSKVQTVILHLPDGAVEVEMIQPQSYGEEGIWVPQKLHVPKQKTTTENQNPVYAQGSFDNIMGYSGYYVFYDTYPIDGYYYTEDGTPLVHVWGTVPEDVGIVDLDKDGKNELIANLEWSDGGSDVVVYKKSENVVQYAYCSYLLDEPYDNTGVGSFRAEYLKNTNEVKLSYWIEAEQKYKNSTYSIDYNRLIWWSDDWVDTTG